MLTNARRLCVARRGSAAASAGSLATCLAIPSPRTYPRPVHAHLLGGARRGAPPPPPRNRRRYRRRRFTGRELTRCGERNLLLKSGDGMYSAHIHRALSQASPRHFACARVHTFVGLTPCGSRTHTGRGRESRPGCWRVKCQDARAQWRNRA